MKRILALLLLSPALSFGQLLEVSVKGGVVTNNIRPVTLMGQGKGENPLGSAASLSVTAGLPLNIRAGLSVSAYRVSYAASDVIIKHNRYDASFEYGAPVVPLEAILAKRLTVSKLSFDLGFTGGFCLGKKIVEKWSRGTTISYDKATWLTYGFLAGAQFNITKRFSAGVETQPKWLTIKNYSIPPGYYPMTNRTRNTFLWPVMIKTSVRI